MGQAIEMVALLADVADHDFLVHELAALGPVRLCESVDALETVVSRHSVQVVIANPRDTAGRPAGPTLRSIAAARPDLTIVLHFAPTPAWLRDARAIAETGLCAAYALHPHDNLAQAIRQVLAGRWSPGPETRLVQTLLPPVLRAAEPFAVFSVLHPTARLGVTDICRLCQLAERNVERSFVRSFPREPGRPVVTPLRYARSTLCLHVLWWLARGRPVDELVARFGFADAAALARRLGKYAQCTPTSVASEADFDRVHRRIVGALTGTDDMPTWR